MNTGLIHMYFGDGKGKTTAAIGLAVRASGRGKRVLFAQFLKGRSTGELAPLGELGIKIIRSEKDMGFFFNLKEEQKEAFRAEQARLFEKVNGEIKDAVFAGEPIDLLVLDEALNMDREMFDEEALKDFISNKPESLEIVLTGRPAPEWLTEKADYVTEMKKHKHPYDSGVIARKSIEY